MFDQHATKKVRIGSRSLDPLSLTNPRPWCEGAVTWARLNHQKIATLVGFNVTPLRPFRAATPIQSDQDSCWHGGFTVIENAPILIYTSQRQTPPWFESINRPDGVASPFPAQYVRIWSADSWTSHPIRPKVLPIVH